MAEAGRPDRAKCTACGACAAACPAKALTLAGREMTVADVMREVEKDRAFYERSGGGVTVSGGEALLQSEFVAELLAACRERGIHTTVDTAGDVPFSALEAVLPYTDMFLFDIKAADAELHRQGCGRDNARIVDNLRRLCERGAEVRLRVPVIPIYNDTDEAMRAIGALIGTLHGSHPLDLLRFHRMGGAKYEHLALPYPAGNLEPPDDGRMVALAAILAPYCASVQIQ